MTELMNNLYFRVLFLYERARQSLKNDRGDTNIIAIIIILAIVIALAIIFRTQLMALFNKIWASLTENVGNAI